MKWIYNLFFYFFSECGGYHVDLNNAFLEGIDELDCDEQINKFLKKILKYEFDLNKHRNQTQTDISEQYRNWIENFSEGD